MAQMSMNMGPPSPLPGTVRARSLIPVAGLDAPPADLCLTPLRLFDSRNNRVETT